MSVVSRSSTRGQSNVLGTVLLFGIVITMSVSVVVAGSSVLSTSQTTSSLESATIAFSELDEEISQLGTNQDARRSVSVDWLDGGEGELYVENEGEIRVVLNDTGTPDEEFNESRALGRVVYERDGQMVAYQGGGIWRKGVDADSSAMVSPPNYAYWSGDDDATLVVPIVRVQGDVGSDGVSVHQTDVETLFPSAADINNPIGSTTRLTITVDSEFYRAWQTYIVNQTDAAVEAHPDNRTISLSITGADPVAGDELNHALVAPSGEQITNVGTIDSYRSSTGPWTGPYPERTNAQIVVDDAIEINSRPEIGGDLIATGTIRVTNDPTFHGDVIAGYRPGDSPSEVTSPATFHGLYSTEGDLDMWYSSDATYGDDVVVGGTLDQFGAASIDGDLHVGEVARLDHGNAGTLHGDVVVGEDVHVGPDTGFDSTVADQVVVAGNNVTFTGSPGNWDVDVIAGGNVTVESGATLSGDVDAAEDVYVNGTVNGEITAGGSISGSEPHPPQWTENGDPTAPPMDRLRDPVEPDYPSFSSAAALIDEKSASLGADDADHATTIADVEASGGCSSGCTLDDGRYTLSNVTIADGESLTLDTSSGPVEMYVEDDVHVKGTVDVVGDGAVRVYGDGNLTVEGSSASVSTPQGDATQFWVYLKPDAAGKFRDTDPRFTGVVYGAGSGGDGAALTVTNDAVVNGTLVGSIDQFNSNVELHYDEALDGTVPFGGTDDDATTVRFLHVDSRTVQLSG